MKAPGRTPRRRAPLRWPGSWLVVACLLVGPVAPARAQGKLPPAPLTAEAEGTPPAQIAAALLAAECAQQIGLPALSADLYRQSITALQLDPDAIALPLATALLDAGDHHAAETILRREGLPQTPAWRVLAALSAVAAGRRDIAQTLGTSLDVEVSPAEMPWYLLFVGQFYDSATPRDITNANTQYNRAISLVGNELLAARLQLAVERHRLGLATRNVSSAGLPGARETFERMRHTPFGYEHARNYAFFLKRLDRWPEAVALLNDILASTTDAAQREETLFSLGLLGNRSLEGEGRRALVELVERGANPLRRRQALQLLFESSPAGRERAQFVGALRQWIASPRLAALRDALLLFHAQAAFVSADYQTVIEDHQVFTRDHAASPLRLCFTTLAALAEGKRQAYAEAARLARMALGPDSARERDADALANFRRHLHVFEAESLFAAGDFEAAAARYALLAKTPPAEFSPAAISTLVIKRVLAVARAGLDAGSIIDALAAEISPEVRWRAEWHLARAFSASGDAARRAAAERVARLASREALPPALRGRLIWLQAKLALDQGDFAGAAAATEKITLIAAELDPAAKRDLEGACLLVKAKALLASGQPEPALQVMKTLQSPPYEGTNAAAESCFIESTHYHTHNQLNRAKIALLKLIDGPAYRASYYLPVAYYRLALLAEELGDEANLNEASRRLGEMSRLAPGPTGGDQGGLLHEGRKRRAAILHKLGNFSAAQDAYEELISESSGNTDAAALRLGLGALHEDAGAPDAAESAYRAVVEQPGVPLDQRLEAAYRRGKIFEKKGDVPQAIAIWWRHIVYAHEKPGSPALVDDGAARARHTKAAYWLGRSLYETGDALTKLGRRDEGVAAWDLLIKTGLPYGAAARDRLKGESISLPSPSQISPAR